MTDAEHRPRLLSALATLAALGVLTALPLGCNTVEGAGKDVSAAGDAISTAADDTESAMSNDK